MHDGWQEQPFPPAALGSRSLITVHVPADSERIVLNQQKFREMRPFTW
jgi:hypothetical protein